MVVKYYFPDFDLFGRDLKYFNDFFLLKNNLIKKQYQLIKKEKISRHRCTQCVCVCVGGGGPHISPQKNLKTKFAKSLFLCAPMKVEELDFFKNMI